MINISSLLNFSSVLVCRILPAILYLIALPIFINKYGELTYSELVIFYSFISFCITFETSLNYFFFNRFSNRSQRQVTNIIRLYLPVILRLCYLIYLLAICFSAINIIYKIDFLTGAIFLLLILPPLFISTIFFSYWQSVNKGYVGNGIRSIIDVMKAAGLLLSAIYGGGIYFACLVFVIGYYLRSICDLLAIKKYTSISFSLKITSHKHNNPLNYVFKKVYPVFTTSIISSILLFLDKPICLFLFGKEAVVNLGIANEIASKTVIIQYGMAFLFSFYIGKNKRDTKLAYKTKKVFFLAVSAVIVICLLPLFLFSYEILELWLSPDIAMGSYLFLQILLCAQAVYMITNVFEMQNSFSSKAELNVWPYLLMFISYFTSLSTLSYLGAIAIPISLLIANITALITHATRKIA